MTNHKGNPFFFDSHVFDPEDPRYSPVDRTKPRLEYTQAQMQDAKDAAFEMGRLAGFKEAQASLMQEVEKTTQRIEQEVLKLHTQEAARAHLYEGEAVRAALVMLEALFPQMKAQGAMAEIAAFLAEALHTHRERGVIAIEVHPDMVPEVEKFMAKQPQETKAGVQIRPVPGMGRVAAKVLWANGGVTYDLEKMHGKISATVQEALAVHGISVHD